ATIRARAARARSTRSATGRPPRSLELQVLLRLVRPLGRNRRFLGAEAFLHHAQLVLAGIDALEPVLAGGGRLGLLDDVAVAVDEIDLGVDRGGAVGQCERALDLGVVRVL